MKIREKRKEKNKSLFYSYAGSFLSLFFLTFVIIGALLLDYYVSDLSQSYREMEEYKVSLAESELDKHLELTDHARYKIATTFTWYPSYFEKEEYKRIEALKQFTQFTDTSFFLKEYYLFYLDRGEVFRYDGLSSNFDDWIKRNLEGTDSQDMMEKLRTVDQFAILKPEKNMLWLCFPVRFYTTSQDSAAMLVCRVNEQEFLAYVTKHMGVLDNRVAIYYDEELLTSAVFYDPEESEHGLSQKKEEFWIDYTFSAQQYFGAFSLFKMTNIVFIILAVVVLVGIAFQMGYHHFSKVREVSKRIEDKLMVEQSGNELHSIEEMFGYLYEQKEYSIQQLRIQMKILKQYLILSLIAGKWKNEMKEQLELLHIDLWDKQLAVLRISLTGVGRTAMEKLMQDIESLSDGDVQYYAEYEEGKDEIVVIMTFEVEAQCRDATETVATLLEAEEIAAEIRVGTVYSEVHQIANSYMETSRYYSDVLKRGENSGQEDFYSSEYMHKLEVAIMAGNQEEAYKWLHKLCDKATQVDSILFQKYMCSGVLSVLIRVANKQQISFSQQQVSNLLVAEKLSVFSQRAMELVQVLCESVQGQKNKDESDILYAIKKYVEEHFLDDNLTMESVADEFHISANYLSHAFKKSAGKNYKEYVIQLKIEYAKKLLRQGKPVLQVSEALGYANPSYFIRIFKKQTGLTPMGYQNSEETEV